ncbi:MAG: carbonic anhydrase [Cellvibrionales bacterium]|nr:carbonic anhydrase [Cellvibrionales bacterium]
MINDLLSANKAWAEAKKADQSDYFEKLSQGQSPEYLWIGCADSRIPAESLLGLQPGELFVHRNVANQAQVNDPNSMSVVQYAVTALKVKHIIVCGHVGCGGVKGALTQSVDGYLDAWLAPVVKIAQDNKADLDALATEDEKTTLLAKLNVKHQIDELAKHPIIKAAWEVGQDLALHGWLFDMPTGELVDLDLSVKG